MSNKNECYCCHEENDNGKWIRATKAIKLKDGTNSEKRWVCNNCHQIEEE